MLNVMVSTIDKVAGAMQGGEYTHLAAMIGQRFTDLYWWLWGNGLPSFPLPNLFPDSFFPIRNLKSGHLVSLWLLAVHSFTSSELYPTHIRQNALIAFKGDFLFPASISSNNFMLLLILVGIFFF